jgi:release factor glutamine methyltransferase
VSDPTLAAVLEAATAELQGTGEDAGRQARELVAALLGQSAAAVAMSAADGGTIAPAIALDVRAAAERLRRGMPFAYAVGTAPFRHLELVVDPRVLIPRPETELLIDHVLRLTQSHPGGVAADVGTGSGALALALAQEAAFERIVATDISADALAVAQVNAARVSGVLRAPVEFRLGADLAPLADCRAPGRQLALLISNPPYIAYDEAEALPAAVRDWEPPMALFADEHGQARYRVLLEGAPALLRPGGWIVLECDSTRAAETAEMARGVGAYDAIRVHDDLAGRPRILVAQRRPAHE